ncbi:hypothetical protein ACWGJW_28765 [Streptomyces nigrescens]
MDVAAESARLKTAVPSVYLDQLEAMHLSFGKPAFRRTPPEPLGIGAGWAFTGKRLHLQLVGSDGGVDVATLPGMTDTFRRATQYTEYQLLAGPRSPTASPRSASPWT